MDQWLSQSDAVKRNPAAKVGETPETKQAASVATAATAGCRKRQLSPLVHLPLCFQYLQTFFSLSSEVEASVVVGDDLGLAFGLAFAFAAGAAVLAVAEDEVVAGAALL